LHQSSAYVQQSTRDEVIIHYTSMENNTLKLFRILDNIYWNLSCYL